MKILGNVYTERFIKSINPNDLRKDWQKALEFFFNKAFYQGRRNDVSVG
jgi:hypothetical protein